MRIAAITLITVMIFLSGCANGSSARLSEMKAGSRLPVMDQTETRKGVDLDDNGIRDDIDDYIGQLDLPDKGIEMAQNIARGHQRIQVAEKMTPENAFEILNSFSGDVFCGIVGTKIDSDSVEEVLRDIEAMTKNTEIRLSRYKEYSRIIGGRIGSLPSFRECIERGFDAN